MVLAPTIEARIAGLRREFCTFFEVPAEDLDARIEEGVAALREEWVQWRRRRPNGDPVGFYMMSRNSRWSWLQWAIAEYELGWLQEAAEGCRHFGAQGRAGRVLDFGAGLGEAGLYLAETLGVSVVFADICGWNWNFLRWRLAQRANLDLRAVESRRILGCGTCRRARDQFDVVLCLEVLEHIPEAEKLLLRLTRKCRGALMVSGPEGRAPDDPDPLHVWKDSPGALLEAQGWKLARKRGGKPAWFTRDPGKDSEAPVEAGIERDPGMRGILRETGPAGL